MTTSKLPSTGSAGLSPLQASFDAKTSQYFQIDRVLRPSYTHMMHSGIRLVLRQTAASWRWALERVQYKPSAMASYSAVCSAPLGEINGLRAKCERGCEQVQDTTHSINAM
jgi:hypothetical protein